MDVKFPGPLAQLPALSKGTDEQGVEDTCVHFLSLGVLQGPCADAGMMVRRLSSGIPGDVQSQWECWTLGRHSLPPFPSMRGGTEMSKYQDPCVLPSMPGTTVYTKGSSSPSLV